MDMEAQQEDNTARGVVNQEGSDDADKFQAVAEQVVVKEPEPEPVKEEEIFVAVEQQPEFPGGTAALMKWLASNVRYPQMALENGISGRVIVKFVVEKDGSVSGVTLVRGVDKDLDREAIRVVKSMPKWQPGKNNGQAVRCYFNLPVNFKLAEQ
jgi:protein TonB